MGLLGRLARQSVARQTLLLGFAVLALNLLDATFTLRHLDHGAEELNPLMRALLARGAAPFIAVKHGLAAAGILGIAAHPRAPAAQVALWILFPMYFAIAAYQTLLFWFIP